MPGWEVITVSRGLAVAVAAMPGGIIAHGGKGEWRARLPGPDIAVTVTQADSGELWCRLAGQPDSGCLVLAFAPWPARAVLKSPGPELPTQGRLSVRDVRIITRMGRTVRYLVPEFTAIRE